MDYTTRIHKILDGLDVGCSWEFIAICAVRILAFGVIMITQAIDRNSTS